MGRWHFSSNSWSNSSISLSKSSLCDSWNQGILVIKWTMQFTLSTVYSQATCIYYQYITEFGVKQTQMLCWQYLESFVWRAWIAVKACVFYWHFLTQQTKTALFNMGLEYMQKFKHPWTARNKRHEKLYTFSKWIPYNFIQFWCSFIAHKNM